MAKKVADKEPRIPIAEDPARLTKGAARVAERLASGRLCKQFVQDERFSGAAFWIEPSGKAVDRAAAEELIAKGRVRPMADSLFADDSQSFVVA